MSRNDKKEAILARLDESRGSLGDQLAGLGAAVNLSRRVRHAVRRHPFQWIAGSVGSGVLLSSLLRVGGTKSAREGVGISSRPILLGGLAFLGNQIMAFSLPALKQLAEVELSRWLQSRSPETESDDAAAED